MRTPTKVLGFVAVLALVLVAGWGAGRWLGPDPAAVASATAADHAHESVEPGGHGPGHEDGHKDEHEDEREASTVGGLPSSAAGYALRLEHTTVPAGRQDLAFEVTGPDGPVTDYDVQHEKELHLVVVRRDLTGFQHVHPERDDAGTWRVDVDLRPGTWRVLADFDPADGEPQVLGTDLFVPGDFRPVSLGKQALATTVDGYDVNLGGSFQAGVGSTLTATVSRDGEVVDDLQPYLGATGHLVALRAGDLGYLHVHPEDGAFHTSFPTEGSYRLFLDFKHRDVVRTAAFTVDVGSAGHDHGTHDHGTDDHGTGEPADEPADDHGEEEHGHDH